jgi:DNA-binding XRE family transcriptional regulator
MQQLQYEVPAVFQRLERVTAQIYTAHLQGYLDAARKRWYVRLAAQYLAQHLLTLYRRRLDAPTHEHPMALNGVGKADTVHVDASLERTLADSYQDDAWQALGQRLARELSAEALATLLQEVGVSGVEALSEEAFTKTLTASVAVKAPEPLGDRVDRLLTRTAQDVAVDTAKTLALRAPSLAELEHLLGFPATAPVPAHLQRIQPLLWEEHLTVMNASHYQAVREAIYKNTFQRLDGIPWPTALLAAGPARGQIQLRPVVVDAKPLMPPEEAEAWAHRMWQQRAELSDLDADALDALSALWLAQARTPKDDAIANVDNLLAMRGLRPRRSGQGRRGGYEPEQRTAMLQALSHIQSLWLNMTELEVYEGKHERKRQRQPTTQGIQSRAFVITDLFGQIRQDGFMDVEKFIFRPGKVFAHFLFGAGRQTALLAAQALRYDPLRQTWEKRLTRYLSYQWRCRAHNGDYMQPYRVATLLEAIGAHVNLRDPARTRARLEHALDTLLADGVLAAWQYDRWEEALVGRRGWVQHWLQATILIEPPDTIRERYQYLAQHEESLRQTLPAPDSLGERLKRQRQRLGLTQIQVAEQLGLSPSYLNRLERGHRGKKLSAAGLQKIEAWIAAHPESE